MMKTVKALTGRFVVLNDATEVHKTKNSDEAQNKVQELMDEKVEKIYLRDDKEKRTIMYTRESHQRNYRLQNAPYVAPEELPTSEAVPSDN